MALAQTLAKVAKLDAVRQQLWGLELAAPARVGAAVLTGAPRKHRCNALNQQLRPKLTDSRTS